MTQEIRDMYATREFTQNEIAGKFGISITAVNNAIHKGYVPKPKGMTETKERTELIEEHIMEFFDTEEELIKDLFSEKVLTDEDTNLQYKICKGYDFIKGFRKYYQKNGTLTEKQLTQLKRLASEIAYHVYC